ncbi:MAG TPA: lipopolysaccharide biosynthesis protein [Methylomirabilota bacterium]|nr:lipopolysaccharide biosynthesis protein [Methylomirabilota bacterium]
MSRAADYFAPDRGALRRRTLSGGVATGVGQAITLALHFASLAMLARLLAPDDFGLVAMVTTVTGFMTLFGDSGLSTATVQRAEINHVQVSTLFWINTGLGVALMFATWALAPLLAWFYNEPRLVGVTLATSVGFVFRGLGVQHAALLKRRLEFARLMQASVGGALAGYALGVIAAWQGLGYWALVLQSVGTAAATTLATWMACPWRPGAAARNAGVGGMIGFGGALTGSNLLIHLLRNFDSLLIGWYWGAASLGLYSRGYAIMMMPMSQLNGPINQVAMPALSRVQHDGQRFREAYFQGVTLMAGISLPACVFLAACAEPFILTVLGEHWRDLLPIFLALAPAAALSTLTNAVGWVYNALGLAGRQLKWTLFAVPVYLAGFALALPRGPTAVAASFSILLTVLFLPTFWFAYRGTPLRVADLLRTLWRPVTSALTAGAITWFSLRLHGVAALSPAAQLGFGAVLFAAVYGAACVGVPGGRGQMLRTWRYLAGAFARPPSPPNPSPAPALATP